MTMRAASGRATKLSTSLDFRAVMERIALVSGAGDEVRREPCHDVVGDYLAGAAFRIAQPALSREPLLLTGNIVGDPCKRLPRHHDPAGGDLRPRVRRID